MHAFICFGFNDCGKYESCFPLTQRDAPREIARYLARGSSEKAQRDNCDPVGSCGHGV